MTHLPRPFTGSDIAIYGGLALTTSVYAIVLERYKKQIEPDWTWAEVVLGTMLCLSAAELRIHRQELPTAIEYRRAVWMCFVIGGAPIVLWQFWQMSQRYHRVIKEWKRESNADPEVPLA